MNNIYHNEYNLGRYHKLRAEYVGILGGKCAKCNTTKALHFDHIIPEDKVFNIGERITYPKPLVLEELKKCQLLCAACHIDKTRYGKDGYDKRAKGEQVNNAKLTEELVIQIRKEMEFEKSDLTLANKYGVTKAALYQVRNRRTWKHI